MQMVRTFLTAALARPTFWGEAILAAAHICNRMPCSANPNHASPFRIRYGRMPRIRHFQPWGITAYVRRFEQQNKLQQRADAGIFVGYGHEVTNQKGWRIYVPLKRDIVTSSNVTFDSNMDESVNR